MSFVYLQIMKPGKACATKRPEILGAERKYICVEYKLYLWGCKLSRVMKVAVFTQWFLRTILGLFECPKVHMKQKALRVGGAHVETTDSQCIACPRHWDRLDPPGKETTEIIWSEDRKIKAKNPEISLRWAPSKDETNNCWPSFINNAGLSTDNLGTHSELSMVAYPIRGPTAQHPPHNS